MPARRSGRLKRSAGRPKSLQNFVTDFDTQSSEDIPARPVTANETGESDLDSESVRPMTSPEVRDFVSSPHMSSQRAADSTSGIYNVCLSSSDDEKDSYMACFQPQKKMKPFQMLPSSTPGTQDNSRDANHNKSQASSEDFNLHLSDDSGSDCGDEGDDDDVVVLSDDDRVAPNSKVTWRDLNQLTVGCGPVLTDLKVLFPNVPWVTVGPLVVKLMGPKGQQVQIIFPTKKPQKSAAKKSKQTVVMRRSRRLTK